MVNEKAKFSSSLAHLAPGLIKYSHSSGSHQHPHTLKLKNRDKTVINYGIRAASAGSRC